MIAERSSTGHDSSYRPLRILLAVGSLAGGGAERVVAWLANSLAERGDTVCLLTQKARTHDFFRVSPAVTRVAVGEHRYLDSSKVSGVVNRIRLYHAIRTTTKRESIDVVLSFIDRFNVDVLLSLVASRIPVVVAERTDPAHSVLTPLLRGLRPHLYRHLARTVVVQREVTANILRREWRLPSVVTIPNAMLLATNEHSVGSVREKVVLSVGRLSAEKGHSTLIESWGAVAHAWPGWRLRIAGDGPLRPVLEAQAHRLGIANVVDFLGTIADVTPEYRSASVFVLPSRFEGFPNALLEAMAAGCPPIASNTAGASVDLIRSGHNGLLVPPEDSEVLAQALITLMSNAELRTRYGVESMNSLGQFSQDRVIHLWRELLLSATH